MLIFITTFLFTASQLVLAAEKAAPSPPLPQLKLYDIISNKSITTLAASSVTTDIKPLKLEIAGTKFETSGKYSVSALKHFNQAKITFDDKNRDVEYTLVFVDLDWKNEQADRTGVYNQFFSINIPGKHDSLINAESQTMAIYEQPNVPCRAKEHHRLLLLAFEQPQNLEVTDVSTYSASSKKPEKRRNIDLTKLGSHLQLKVKAATVFYVYGDSGGTCSGSAGYSSKSVSSSLLLIIAIATGCGQFLFGRKVLTTN